MLPLQEHVDKTLEDLDELYEKLSAAYDRYLILEADFKPRRTRLVYENLRPSVEVPKLKLKSATTKPRVTKKTATEAKAAAEMDISADPAYAEYVRLPIEIEKYYRQIKILDLRLQALSQKMALLRQTRPIL